MDNNILWKRTSRIHIGAATLAVLLVAGYSACDAAEGAGGDSSPTPEAVVNSTTNQSGNMDPIEKVDIAVGQWGGQGISMNVENNGATLEFDCAEATISSKLRAAKDGQFTFSGLLKRSGPGPIRLNAPKREQAVRFEGTVTGKQMKMTITFTEGGELMGTYTLEHGKHGRIRRCL